jgi:hypothetical protein
MALLSLLPAVFTIIHLSFANVGIFLYRRLMAPLRAVADFFALIAENDHPLFHEAVIAVGHFSELYFLLHLFRAHGRLDIEFNTDLYCSDFLIVMVDRQIHRLPSMR